MLHLFWKAHAQQSAHHPARARLSGGTTPDHHHQSQRHHHLLQRSLHRHQRLQSRGADVRAAQPDPSPRRPAGGVRPHVDHPQSRPPVDGDRQEPLQERRPLLGQRLCHADLRPGRGGRLRVGAGQADRRTDPARRGPLPSPRRRQAGDPPARPLAAGTARLAAVHPDQPDRLPHRYLAELLVGLHPRRPARRSARPGRTALAEARAEAPDAARRTDHLRPADRADVHRQPRRPGAPGNRWPPRSTRWPPPPRKWRTMSS